MKAPLVEPGSHCGEQSRCHHNQGKDKAGLQEPRRPICSVSLHAQPCNWGKLSLYVGSAHWRSCSGLLGNSLVALLFCMAPGLLALFLFS